VRVDSVLHAYAHAVINAARALFWLDSASLAEYCDEEKAIVFSPFAHKDYLVDAIYQHLGDVFKAASEIMWKCVRGCKDGCPSCLSLVNCCYANLGLKKHKY